MAGAPVRRDGASRPGERLVLVGGSLATAGVLAVLLSLVPVFLRSDPMPVVVRALVLLVPLGVGVAGAGVRRRRRS
jgi:hypothetical protein